MNIRIAAALGLAPGLMFLTLAMAAPTAEVQAEVGYLLQHVEDSGCMFYRNGLWYDGARAGAHLKTKYQYLVARDQVKTTEDFIERAATKSSLSGIAYQIRCTGSAAVDSNRWLLDALAAYRLAQQTLPVR